MTGFAKCDLPGGYYRIVVHCLQISCQSYQTLLHPMNHPTSQVQPRQTYTWRRWAWPNQRYN